VPRNAAAPELKGGVKQVISFGLVNLPVKVKPLHASRKETSVGTNYVCPTHKEKVSTKRFCDSCDSIVEAVKMFPTDSGYVDIEEEVLASLAADKTGELRIDRFVDDEIDPIWFEKPYIVAPGEGGQAVYDLLAQAMRDAGKAAEGNAVFGGAKSTRKIIVRWSDKTETLVAHTCVYDTGIRWADVDTVANGMKARPAPTPDQVDFASQVIDQLAGDFDPEAVEDTYTPVVRDLIAQAAAGKKLTAPAKAPKQEASVDDLMAALRDSVAATADSKPKAKANGKKPARKPKAAA
jgi:DNA end-binding protein Ku